MHQPDQKTILHLLVKTYNNAITDYYYFPEVVFAGQQRMDPEHFRYILSEGFIAEYKHDIFGRYYQLSKKGQHFLYEHLVLPKPKKKRPVQSAQQASLYFTL